eukprot:6475912-Amphidinium_carterae.1
MQRRVFIKLPPEDPRAEDPNACGLLLTALNGVRDAGQAFEVQVTQTMEAGGFKQGAFSPCVYAYQGGELCVIHHGDDFISCGKRGKVGKTKEALERTFIVKDHGTLGPATTDTKEIR